MTLAEVQLWGRTIGAVLLEEGGRFAAFQYDPAFARSGIEVSPITMPLGDRVYVFLDLPPKTFHGLPGLLADSLPDRFGNALIDAWLATQGRNSESFNAVERLCYTGARGMGALEFAPAIGPKPQPAKKIEINALVKLASEVLSHRQNLKTTFASTSRKNALNEILRVGTSAGGARAKAVIAWNRETNEVRSGQIVAGKGFNYWLLKFDGVTGNKDKELDDPKGYGAIEYAYYLMAKAAGITMSECRLLEEGGRRHFMTRRFDRLAGVPGHPPGGFADGGGRGAIPADGVQHHRPQSGRPCEEHRLPDGQDGALVTRSRLRRDLQLQPERRLDLPASDDDERQARWIHAGGFSRLRQKCLDETWSGRSHR